MHCWGRILRFFFPLIIWLWQGSEQTTPKMNCKAGEKLESAPLNLSLSILPVCIFLLLLRCNTPQENTYIACYLREVVVMLCDLLLFANQLEDLQRMEILRCWETGDSHAWDDTVYRKQSTVLLALEKKKKVILSEIPPCTIFLMCFLSLLLSTLLDQNIFSSTVLHTRRNCEQVREGS